MEAGQWRARQNRIEWLPCHTLSHGLLRTAIVCPNCGPVVLPLIRFHKSSSRSPSPKLADLYLPVARKSRA